MSLLIDFHVHVFPNSLESWVPRRLSAALDSFLPPARLSQLRKQARAWMKPLSNSAHSAQTLLRYLPELARNRLDELSSFLPLPSLLFESSAEDLKEAMEDARIDYAMVIAYPPLIDNDFIMDICQKNPKLLPVVNISKGTARPGQILKRYVGKGAKALKLHPASDGEGVDSPRYRALIRSASDLGLPIILHTGCLHSKLFYKDPSQGHAERFTPWFETYPDTQFVLAHMNFHEPNIALDICEEYRNVWVDTSWQPAEVIGEAVRRIGPERILFGSDWPFVGNNIAVGRDRVRDCVNTGMLNQDQAKLILGENAVKLLGLKVDAN
jgi:predicted TIM-barrel fold metal-dependent hydrolase